jgi:hypothetical protein
MKWLGVLVMNDETTAKVEVQQRSEMSRLAEKRSVLDTRRRIQDEFESREVWLVVGLVVWN